MTGMDLKGVTYIGEAAGLATAFLWTLSAIAWSHASKKTGAIAVSTIRLTIASVILMFIHLILYKTVWPFGAEMRLQVILVFSGIAGAAVGDMLFFYSLKNLGPRLGMLIASLSPAVSAVMAYAGPMHEKLGVYAILGMVMTMGGVAWVVIDENRGENAWVVPEGKFTKGVMMALLAVFCYGIGFVLSRAGMEDGKVPAFSATLMRVVSACIFSWLFIPFIGRFRQTFTSMIKGESVGIITCGTLVGPVFGIWMSMISVAHVETGVATALITTSPIFVIPLSYFSHGEKPTIRGVIGALIAVGGVFLLVYRNSF